MELSVREAAVLMGRSPRTVRAQLARGELPGVKRDGQWRVHRRHLPLTEDQRRALQAKADGIRELVDDVLPGRVATTSKDKTRSLADLDAFRSPWRILPRRSRPILPRGRQRTTSLGS